MNQTIDYLNDDISLAFSKNDKISIARIAKGLYSLRPDLITFTDNDNIVLTYPEETAFYRCDVSFERIIQKYSQSIGSVKLCYRYTSIARDSLFSVFFIVFISIYFQAIFLIVFQKKVERARSEERMRHISNFNHLAAQVAHDIRSPLSALSMIEKDLTALPENSRVIVRQSIARIRDIANNLILQYRKDKTPLLEGEPTPHSRNPSADPSLAATAQTLPPQLLPSLIESLMTEKRIQYRERLSLEISYTPNQNSYGLFAEIDPTEFKRVLSNLINNSAEAIEHQENAPSQKQRGQIILSTERTSENEIRIQIKDNGKGIPAEFIKRLGIRGETFGKKEGSGLGISHAITTLEKWKGRFEITQSSCQGTIVSIHLPAAKAPRWFLETLKLKPNSWLTILDDDASIHTIWSGRFSSLRVAEKNIKLLHFSSPKEFKTWFVANPDIVENSFFLMDYELLGHHDTGISLIEAFNLSKQSALVTSRYEEQRILSQCLELQIPLIPKPLAGFVPVELVATST